MRNILKYLYFLYLLFIFTIKVNANSINSIKMDIYIDENGNAHVLETWDANLNSGTEGYHPYFNLGNATITNYTVKDESKDYTIISDWNISASLSDKAYKAGIYKIGDELNLCWGISSYGRHTYTLSYTINGFVAEADDSQIIYWTLIPPELSSKPDTVYIKIYADEKFEDTLDVWGYGNYGGYAYVYDGYIELSKNNLENNEYMTVLVKFEKGTFNTSNFVNHDFNYYYDLAEENSIDYHAESESTFNPILFIVIFFIYIPIYIIGFFVIVKSISTSKFKSGSFKMDYGEVGKKLPKDVNMIRELPCNKDIYRAYWVAYNYGLMKKQTDFLGVIFLKWLKQGKIKIESKTVKSILKKEDSVIVFNEEDKLLDNQLEADLYYYMYQASKDGILESKEFEKWCRNNYSKILNWFDKVLDYENERLLEERKIVKQEKTTLKIFKSEIYKVDPSMKKEAILMKGLKLFFNNFENMKDKQAIEVMLWEEYLIYAQIFGVANKVAKQFKELYPDVITDYSYNSIIFLNSISYSSMTSASSAKSRANSYHSGGGGFSSGGGGRSSFGGGGRGGGFR